MDNSEVKPAKREISPTLVEKLKTFLGPEGTKFFRDTLEKHGQIDAVFMDGRIPHPVHFREGMQVRNFMRGQEECEGWTDHEYDDNWVEAVAKAIA